MKRKTQNNFLVVAMSLFFLLAVSCNPDDDVAPISQQRSELIFTEITGADVHPHGDHFHGLDKGVEGKVIVVKFNDKGESTANGTVTIDSKLTYRVDLKTWDKDGKEVQQDYLASKVAADNYKAFLVGGNFVLNPNASNESGALFQPRELKYGDGTAVNGKYETTGILTYLILGETNKGTAKKVSYILRKIEAGVKAKIERVDWNRNDYATVFAGQNILDLKFEIKVN